MKEYLVSIYDDAAADYVFQNNPSVVDVQEFIRCKDCKYLKDRINHKDGTMRYKCTKFKERVGLSYSCDKAERKENADY